MSDTTPVNPQPRELEIIKVLFDRHLSNRAVALAESRWPGSGAMIRLAYDWTELSPEGRRERISDIGPEDLARLKSLAALNPELEQVIGDLDDRGVLPHLEEATLAGTAAAGAALNQAAADVRQEPTYGVPDEEPVQAEELSQPPSLPGSEPGVATGAPVSERLHQIEEMVDEYDLENFDFDELKVDMPDLESDMPSTSEFLAEQEVHRQAAVARADAAMERVRRQLDQTASRVLSGPVTPDAGPSPAAELSAIAALPELKEIAPVELRSEPMQSESGQARITEPPAWLVEAAEDNVVTQVDIARSTPTPDELVALANQRGLELAEFTVEPGTTRDTFGGLIRAGNTVDVSVGPLPLAMGSGSLVIVHGRLFQKAIDRLSDGYCDLPGTRATVRLHEATRVLIIPN